MSDMELKEIVEFCRNVQEHYSTNSKDLERKHRIHYQLIDFCRHCNDPEKQENKNDFRCPKDCEIYKAFQILWRGH